MGPGWARAIICSRASRWTDCESEESLFSAREWDLVRGVEVYRRAGLSEPEMISC